MRGIIHDQSHAGSVLRGRDETRELSIATSGHKDPESRDVPHVVGICRGDKAGHRTGSENALRLRSTFQQRQVSSFAAQWEFDAGAALLNVCLTQPPKTHTTSPIPVKAFEESTAINSLMYMGKRD